MALSPNQLQNISNELEDLWGDFETEVLSQLAQRIKANDYTVSSTTRWQRAKMKELGYTNDYINQRLSVYLKKTEVEVKAIFDKAIEGALKSNDEIISEAHELGLLQSSGYDIEKYAPLITTGARQTFNEIKNWTKSYHAEVNKNFQIALDRAYLNVTSGLLSSSEATKQAIEELAKKGILTSSTSKDRVEHAETIVKRAIRSGVNQTTSKVMDGVLDDLDCDLIEVSSHLGARPSHAEWQGKVYSRSGKDKKYPDFVEATGYGSGDGLSGWNCRHSFYPFFEGLSSVSAKRISMEENERVYHLQQQQRYNERVIRKYRREETVLKSGELDHSTPKRKAIEWTKKNNELIKSNSDVLKKPIIRKKKIVSIKDEFMKEATPGVGSIAYYDGFKENKHNYHEIGISEKMLGMFGGNIEHLKSFNIEGQYYCDFLWNEKKWELKGLKGTANIKRNIKKGFKQIYEHTGNIEAPSGGIIIDILIDEIQENEVLDVFSSTTNKKGAILILLRNGELKGIYK